MKWQSRSVVLPELQATLENIQQTMVDGTTGEIKFVIEKQDKTFLVVWTEPFSRVVYQPKTRVELQGDE